LMTVELAAALPPEGHNAILDVLGGEARRTLEERLTDIELEVQQPLSAEEEGVDGLYFPISCVMCRRVASPRGPRSRCRSSVGKA